MIHENRLSSFSPCLSKRNNMYKRSWLAYAVLLFLAIAGVPVKAGAQSAFDDPGARSGSSQGGDFVAVSSKIDAGSVSLGSSGQVVVLFRNDDSKPLNARAINLYPSSNISASISENQCAKEPIQPGEVCAISVQVKGLQKGNFRIEMLIRHDGRTKLITATIDGTVESSGDNSQDVVSDIEAIPSEMDFGTLNESRSQVKALVLRNKTSKPINISSIDVEAGSQSGYTVNANCGELQTGEACVASVTWSPEKKGPSTGTIIVRHSGATGVSTVELKGAYDPDVAEAAQVFPEAIPGKGLLVSSMEDIDFGSGVSQSASISVSLVNVGDVPLTLTGIRMANSENGVRAEQTGCVVGAVLSPLEACPLTMTWEPVREGSIVDDVQVSHTGARGVLIMPLRGSATKAVNKDTKAIMIGDDTYMKNIKPLTLDDIEDDGETVVEAGDAATVKKSGKAGKKEDAGASDEEDKGDSAAPTAASKKKTKTRSPVVDVRGVLEGYTITSYSTKRAIISGPGGSRVVFDGEQSVIGGVLWKIKMRPNAIEFQNGTQKVLLLFDKSLSSVNTVTGESSSGESTTPPAVSTPPTVTTTTP